MFEPQEYLISSKLFVRLLGLVYFFAFSAFIFQIKGLLGAKGILPVYRFLHLIRAHTGKKSFYLVPNVFWIHCSDKGLLGVVLGGTGLSLLLALGIYPPLMLFLLYILYLSIVSVGQDFLSFGWEMFLLEITANAFLLSLTPVPNPIVWISLNLLLFRFHFQGGVVKLMSRDANWRNLTAVAYHYQTQPLPNTIAWFAHKLPLSFQKFSTGFMFFVELIVPFGIFVNNQEVRIISFILLLSLQFFIWVTGNFSYLNHLTAAFCVILVSDKYWVPIYGQSEGLSTASPSIFAEVFAYMAGGILLFLQVINLWNHLIKWNPVFSNVLNYVRPFHLANRYGIFAIMTTERYEIIVEGSQDGFVWEEYLFYFKPSEVTRRPMRISPFQPRIDWQIWFLPFTSYESEAWFQNFMYHLLAGTPEVLSLLRHNPFPDQPPRYVRAVAYQYVFSDRQTKKQTGAWWKRTFVMSYCPAMTLKRNI
jgi:hypothetical protein